MAVRFLSFLSTWSAGSGPCGPPLLCWCPGFAEAGGAATAEATAAAVLAANPPLVTRSAEAMVTGTTALPRATAVISCVLELEVDVANVVVVAAVVLPPEVAVPTTRSKSPLT